MMPIARSLTHHRKFHNDLMRFHPPKLAAGMLGGHRQADD
jgi:hypothetical protein